MAAIVGTALALALVFPLTNLNIGEPQTSALATTGSAHSALAGLSSAGVPTGVVAPIEVLVDQRDANTAAGVLGRLPGVYSAVTPSGPQWHKARTTVVEVVPSGEPSSANGSATITAVRDTAKRLEGVLGTGGDGPSQQDFSNSIYGNFPLMLALIAVGHVPFAGPGLSQCRPGGKSRPVQHPFGVRRVRDDGAHLAVRLR